MNICRLLQAMWAILPLGLSAPALATADTRTPSRNVLFIITDQQFADAMSCRMGKAYLNTPSMDRLAQGGALFTRAYTSNPLCVPSANSIFTGRYPHDTGVTSNNEPRSGLNPKDFTCLGVYFRKAGYETAYSGKWHLCFPQKAIPTHGFEIVTERVSGDHDAGVTAGAVKFLRRPHEKPFLLVVSLLNPHNELPIEPLRLPAGCKRRHIPL